MNIMRKKRVKCNLVQALRLCTGRTANRGSSGIAVPFLDHGTRRRWGVIVTPRPLFVSGKDPVPTVQEAGWAPGPVWTGAENLASPPAFDPRTVRPIASRYSDYTTRPFNVVRTRRNIILYWHYLVCCTQINRRLSPNVLIFVNTEILLSDWYFVTRARDTGWNAA
jgi:hypothetical protein